MGNVVLTGFMGTGKSAVGRELAQLLGMELVDVDEMIEMDQQMPIPEIFRLHGEPRFREIETEMIRRVAKRDNLVISTGGGAVLREENMEALRSTGSIFCLFASAETIHERTRSSDNRPLLKADNPMARIRELLAARRPYYEKAGALVDTEGKSPRQIAEEIVEMVRCTR